MKVCPICRQAPQSSLLLKCERCKAAFVNEASLKSSLSPDELKQLATYILRTRRFWTPLVLGLLAVTWLALGIVDYATGRRVQDVIGAISTSVSNSLEKANTTMTNDIARQFEDANMQRLMEDVVTKKALARIDETADKVMEQKIQSQITPRLEKVDSKLQEAAVALSRLQSQSNFDELATRTRSDDRAAFDGIMAMSASDPAVNQARVFLANLPKEIEVSNLLEYQVDWKKLNVDPNTADISMFNAVMRQLQPLQQSKVMETVWNAQQLSKWERIQFLIDVVINTTSLRCLDKGCRLLDQESKVGKNFLLWQEYPKWWTSHRQEYK